MFRPSLTPRRMRVKPPAYKTPWSAVRAATTPRGARDDVIEGALAHPRIRVLTGLGHTTATIWPLAQRWWRRSDVIISRCLLAAILKMGANGLIWKPIYYSALLGILTILFTNLLLQLFEDFSFGEYHLDTIHLSTRGSFDAEGHYECAASVPLP